MNNLLKITLLLYMKITFWEGSDVVGVRTPPQLHFFIWKLAVPGQAGLY
jgi:hypothetical protein